MKHDSIVPNITKLCQHSNPPFPPQGDRPGGVSSKTPTSTIIGFFIAAGISRARAQTPTPFLKRRRKEDEGALERSAGDELSSQPYGESSMPGCAGGEIKAGGFLGGRGHREDRGYLGGRLSKEKGWNGAAAVLATLRRDGASSSSGILVGDNHDGTPQHPESDVARVPLAMHAVPHMRMESASSARTGCS